MKSYTKNNNENDFNKKKIRTKTLYFISISRERERENNFNCVYFIWCYLYSFILWETMIFLLIPFQQKHLISFHFIEYSNKNSSDYLWNYIMIWSDLIWSSQCYFAVVVFLSLKLKTLYMRIFRSIDCFLGAIL